MAELVIPIHNYIGTSDFNWDTFEFEWATNCDDLRMAVQYGLPTGEPVTSIALEIGTCFGGSTIHGTEMYNYLQSLGLPIRTRILSLAASMATVLMLVGEECEIDATAQLLVHGPSMYAEGTATEVGSALKSLTDTHAALRDIYVARTGQPAATVEEWMSKDTWFTAQEALAAGLVTKVISIAPKAAAVVADAQASTRRTKVASIVARAAQRRPKASAPKPRIKSAARPAAPSPRPMAKKVVKPAGKTPAAQTRSALTAAQKPIAEAIRAMAKAAGITATIEGEVTEPTAELVTTAVTDGNLYSDGELAQGVEVFTDESLTVAAEDGIYDAEDGREITVAAGVVESVTDPEAAAEETDSTAAITAAVTAALAPLTQRLDSMEAKFNATTPATPRARGIQANLGGDKGGAKAKPRAAHHTQL